MEGKRKLFKIVSHSGENKRQCLSCERIFIHKQDLIKHATREHNILDEESSCSYTEVFVEGRKKYECKICGRHFKQKRNIILHQNRDHTSVLDKTVNNATDVCKSSDSRHDAELPEVTDLSNNRHRFTADECSLSSDSDSILGGTVVNSDRTTSHSEYYNTASDTLSLESDFIQSDADLNSDLNSSHSEFHNSVSDALDSESDFIQSDVDVKSDINSSESEFHNSKSDSSCETVFGIARGPKSQSSTSQNDGLKILSCFQKHNLTASACKDILDTMKHLIPDSESLLDMDSICSSVGVPDIKEIHYCELCGNTFMQNLDEFKCTSLNCDGLRYKGSLCKQLSRDRQPRKSFVIADIQTQLTNLLQTPGILEDINKCKSEIKRRLTSDVITDITDGAEYRKLNSGNGFLTSGPYNLTAILNTDGINLYSSSKVELWPFFIAINELSPPLRFARDNLLLVAIWQGKGKPPFEKLLEHLGKELESLYNEGIKVSIQDDYITVKVAIVCGVFDLPAKASILNMTYFNGADSCISCEDPGLVVKQGKGHSRCYPYRKSGQEFKVRCHGEVVAQMRQGTDRKRIKGFKGTSGLLAIPSYDIVRGTVPDYMHGILLGIANTLLSKWFSPSHSGKPYFVGKYIETVSRRLQNIRPPLCVERLPRNLEKHFANLKATELQMWLLYYSGPCLMGILPVDYSKHFACLSEAVYILLGDNISIDQIQRAASLLREFYSNFEKLYGQGSCGLNVHNACSHLISYVHSWGPVWAWSCFPFEDANASLLQSAHGTGNVTKQVLKKRHIESVIRANDLKSSADGSLWTVKRKAENCDICGKLQPFRRDQVAEEVLRALPECLADETKDLKVVDRVRVNGSQFCSKKYSRLQRRISYVVLYSNADQSLIGSVQYFIYDATSDLVFAVVLQFMSDRGHDSQIGKHLCKVMGSNSVQIVPVGQLIDTLLYINASLSTPPKDEFVAVMPSTHGHAILK